MEYSYQFSINVAGMEVASFMYCSKHATAYTAFKEFVEINGCNMMDTTIDITRFTDTCKVIDTTTVTVTCTLGTISKYHIHH